MLDRSKKPQTKPFGSLHLPEERCTLLHSGITFHELNHGNGQICKLSMIWNGGTSDVMPRKALSLAMQLIREGSPEIPPHIMDDMIDFNGASLSTQVSEHHSSMHLTCLTSRLEHLLPSIFDCITNPEMPENIIQANLRAAAERLTLAQNKVSYRVSRLNAARIMGSSHPDAQTPTVDSIMSLDRRTLLEVEQAICMSSAGLNVFLTGQISDKTRDIVLQNLERYTSKANGTPYPISIIGYRASSPGIEKITVDGSLQSAVNISFPAIDRGHRDYIQLRLAVMALGGYFGSRLMSNIREDKGYTYGISSALMGALNGAYITIQSQQDHAYTDAVIEETMKEIERLRTKPMGKDELERLRAFAMSQLAAVLDTPFDISAYHSLRLTTGVPEGYFKSQQEIINNMTPQSIMETAYCHINPAQARISIASPS